MICSCDKFWQVAEVSSEALSRAASKSYRAAALLRVSDIGLGIGKNSTSSEAELKSECALNCFTIGLEKKHYITQNLVRCIFIAHRGLYSKGRIYLCNMHRGLSLAFFQSSSEPGT